jgi:FlaA1/EpsC-like NDP-sugar epimerase
MAPSDAVELIKQAYTIIAGAVVVPKMRSLSLVELAAIVAPGSSIVETGLRSTEKLHEDLVHEDELVLDKGAGFVLTERGQTGHRYTSYEAPRLSPADFRRMLSEAESYD